MLHSDNYQSMTIERRDDGVAVVAVAVDIAVVDIARLVVVVAVHALRDTHQWRMLRPRP